MNSRLEGRVAVVTGAGVGLGRAFALHLVALGAAVHVAREIVEAGGRAAADHGDVADPETGEALAGPRWRPGAGSTSASRTRR